MIPRWRPEEEPEGEADIAQQRALRAVDPRRHNPNQRSRMRMLADEPPSNAERGMAFDHFIDPDED